MGVCVFVCVSDLTVCVYIERKKVCNIHLLVKSVLFVYVDILVSVESIL